MNLLKLFSVHRPTFLVVKNIKSVLLYHNNNTNNQTNKQSNDQFHKSNVHVNIVGQMIKTFIVFHFNSIYYKNYEALPNNQPHTQIKALGLKTRTFFYRTVLRMLRKKVAQIWKLTSQEIICLHLWPLHSFSQKDWLLGFRLIKLVSLLTTIFKKSKVVF